MCTYTNIHLHAETSLTVNDDFNTLPYINLSHFLLERVMFVMCERWVETRTDCYIHPSSFSTIAALLSHLDLGCSTVGHWGPQSPQSASWFSRWHPVSDCLKSSGLLVTLFSNVRLLPLFFHLFTRVHLLINGSVEGQYITRIKDKLEQSRERKSALPYPSV